MDLITLALVKPKVIDLDKYGIGAAIMGLVARGGGDDMVEGVGFLDELRGDVTPVGTDIHLVVNYGSSTIDIAGVTRFIDEYEFCDQVCFSFLAVTNDGIGLVSVSIVSAHVATQVYVAIT